MKKKINSLTETVTYSLEAMYDSEKRIQKELPGLIEQLTPGAVKKTMIQYLEASNDKRTKLKRIFSYLLAGPFGRKSKVTSRVFDEVADLFDVSSPSLAREILVTSLLASMIQYRLTSYALAAQMSAHLELDQVTEILEEIIAWEKQAFSALKKIESTKVGLLQNQRVAA